MSHVRIHWIWLIAYGTGKVIARDLEEKETDYCYTSRSVVSTHLIFYLKNVKLKFAKTHLQKMAYFQKIFFLQ